MFGNPSSSTLPGIILVGIAIGVISFSFARNQPFAVMLLLTVVTIMFVSVFSASPVVVVA